MVGNTEKRGLHLIRPNASVGGAACGAVAAGAASMLAAGHAWQVWVPLVFCVVLLAIALGFGTRAGVTGTLMSAAVFAVFLFHPVGSLRVAEGPARANLGWMLLIGLTFSTLFAPPKTGFRRRSRGAETTEPPRGAS